MTNSTLISSINDTYDIFSDDALFPSNRTKHRLLSKKEILKF